MSKRRREADAAEDSAADEPVMEDSMAVEAATEVEVVVPAAVPEPESFPMPLDHFCAHLSGTDRRMTLIAAFNADERRAGRFMDTADNFRARYAAFARRPA